MNRTSSAPANPPALSMWTSDCPEAVECFRRTSFLSRLRARLPLWLGGRPLHELSWGRSKGGLTSITSSSPLTLESQVRLARFKGRVGEVEALTHRLAVSKNDSVNIKRVS